jgi:hypothetical protein
MMQGILIAFVAGVASALMFASLATGATLSFVLVCLSPVPLMVVTLGWGSITGLISAAIAAAGIFFMLGPILTIGALLAIALPAWWLGHLSLLAQPSQDDPNALDWYPVNRLLLWILGIVAAGSLLTILLSGSTSLGLDDASRQELARMLQASGRISADADAMQFVDMMLRILPATMTFFAVIVLVVDLWAAGHVVRLSGRLRRPWPDLSAVSLPHATLGALGLSILLGFLGESAAAVARIGVAILLTAYLLVGLAVIHSVTRSLAGRSLWLGALYFSLLLGWPVLAVAFVGVAEQLFGFRARRQPPPRPTI